MLIYHGTAYSLIRNFIVTRILELLLNEYELLIKSGGRGGGGGSFSNVFLFYFIMNIKILLPKKKKKRTLYSKKKISLYWGQFVISKEPTKLLRKDHLAKV